MSLKNIEDVYPLSPMQQGMLFHSIYAPNSGVYVEQTCFELHGALNVTAFTQAWQQVITRHSALRIACLWENLEKPLQVVCRQVKLSWEQLDWRKIPLSEQQQRLEELLQSERKQGFLLSQAPLMRFILIRLAEQVYHFCWSHHHILLDGWSVPIVYEEVITYYRAFCKGENLDLAAPPLYRDYIAWLQQQDVSQAEVFWRKALSGFTSPTHLGINPATEYPINQEQNYKEQKLKLCSTKTAGLNSFVKQHKLTLNTLIQGLWALLLSRYSGEQNVVFGATVSGRPPTLTNSESMVGLFINTLPVRVQVNPKQELLPWLQLILAQQIEARQYEYAPLVDVQKWSEVPPSVSLFESIVVFENYPLDETLTQPDLNNIKIKNIQEFEKTNYPLTLSIVPGRELLFKIAYQENNRFDVFNIKQMIGHLQTLLEGMIASPYQRLEQLQLLTSAEQQQLLIEWNNTQVKYRNEKCIHELFESQVEETPDSIAVVFENEQLIYRELNVRANQLAHYLQKLGVKPEVLVGICVERSLEMVIGILAILKAGGVYVPLDPSYPQQRLAYMLEDSQPRVLLTQQHLLESLPTHCSQVICIDSHWELIASENTANPLSNTTVENLAYVIYTSGSTGKPKGAMNTHRGVCNRLLWMQDTYQLTIADKVLQKTPFSFDVSVWEFFWTLITGACLVVAQPEGHKDPNYLVNLITQQQITTLHFVPSMLQAFLAAENVKKCQSIKRVIASGEALLAQLQQRFLNQLDAQLHNLYGPTEAAIDVTFWQCQDNAASQNTVPIGRPIANIQIYVLDQYLNPVPIGLRGEIYIAGVGVGRGYFNRPELTAEKFIPNPFSNEPSARLYKTGDLARYLPNGEIEYIGRIDNQVKIRGLRIELGEIETCLSQHPAIQQAVVVVNKDDSGNQMLVGYVVPNFSTEVTDLTSSNLRKFLKQQLPDYMIPSVFVTLPALPLTSNGKIDRQALPVPEQMKPELETRFVPPQTAVEKTLADIWAEVLGLVQVGIHDNFFELGGHSLLATQVISRVRENFQIELPLRCLFESPTIADLSTYIEVEIKAKQGIQVPPLIPVSRDGNLPLSFAQQRLWLMCQLVANRDFYNNIEVLKISGQLNIAALGQSINEIVRRHEVLRTTFPIVQGQPKIAIAPTLIISLPVIDLRGLDKQQREARTIEISIEDAKWPFDLTQGPLLKVTLLWLDSTEYILLLNQHHIISDGWSMGIWIEELTTLYEAYCSGKASRTEASRSLLPQRGTPLPELPIQYVDFAVWQRNWLQGEELHKQLDYWRKQLGQNLTPLRLPTDKPRPAQLTYQGQKVDFLLPLDLTKQLQALSQKEGVTLFMTLLAVFKTLLYCYSGQGDIRVASPIANRNRAEVEKLIGFFVNTLVLRTDLSNHPSFRELLGRVREVTLGAYAHQDLPFEKIVEELQPERYQNHLPLFQVWFVLQNAPFGSLELPSLTLESLDIDQGIARYDLALLLVETSEGISSCFEYSTDLFFADTITRMVEHFQTLLKQIVATPDMNLDAIATNFNQAEKAQKTNKAKELEAANLRMLKNIKRQSLPRI